MSPTLSCFDPRNFIAGKNDADPLSSFFHVWKEGLFICTHHPFPPFPYSMLARLTSNPTSKTGKWNTNMDERSSNRRRKEEEEKEDLITVYAPLRCEYTHIHGWIEGLDLLEKSIW